MELQEVLEVGILLNYYKNLLSDKQRDYLIEHLEDDRSLSEIAKNHNVTRQAVHDNIRRGVKALYEYEEKIGFYKKECEIEEMLESLKDNLTIDEVNRILEELF